MTNLITEIVNNEGRLFYDGNLRHYFRLAFNSRHCQNPYHNFRHTFSVLCRTFEAIRFYADVLSRDQSRALLIGAMFHDDSHSGHTGRDYAEITRAIISVSSAIKPDDQRLLPMIIDIIRATEFPYSTPGDSLPEKIIRDADIVQIFSDAWLQQVIFGLAAEMSLPPLKVLRMQLDFIPKMVFHTDWAEQTYGPLKADKLEEVKGILAILEEH